MQNEKGDNFFVLCNMTCFFDNVFNHAIIEDIAPLVTLQMGSSVINGIISLFTEYIGILERALTHETIVPEMGSLGIKLSSSEIKLAE